MARSSPSFRLPNLRQLYSQPYDDAALEWRRRGAADKVRNLAALVGHRSPEIGDVLEVGCGTGVVLERLAARGLGTKWVGVDVRDRAVSMSAGAASIVAYDGRHIPFPDHAFDLVYATHVLEHVLDEREFLVELRRAAKKYVYVEVPCELHARTTRRALQQSLDIGHINAYSPESFALTLETSGLRIVELGLFDHSYRIHRFHGSPMSAGIKTLVRRSLLRFHPGMASRLLTYHCGALCEPAPLLEL